MAVANGTATHELSQYAQYSDLPGRKVLVTGMRVRSLGTTDDLCSLATPRSSCMSDAHAGSSSGTGKAVALAFASQLSNRKSSKSYICVTSRLSSRLQLVVNELQQLGAEAFAVTGDLTVVEDCTNIVNEAVRLLHMDSIDPACM